RDVAVHGSANLTAGRALTISDVAQHQSTFVDHAVTAGSRAYGTTPLAYTTPFRSSAADSQAAVQQLGAGQSLTDSFTAVSFDGTAMQLSTGLMYGTNDVPVLAGVATGRVNEALAGVGSAEMTTGGAPTTGSEVPGQ